MRRHSFASFPGAVLPRAGGDQCSLVGPLVGCRIYSHRAPFWWNLKGPDHFSITATVRHWRRRRRCILMRASQERVYEGVLSVGGAGSPPRRWWLRDFVLHILHCTLRDESRSLALRSIFQTPRFQTKNGNNINMGTTVMWHTQNIVTAL